MIAGVMLCGAMFGASTLARADHNERFGVLWPKIYAPTITGNLFDDDEEIIEEQRVYERQKLRRAKPRVVKKVAVRTIDDVKRPLVKLPTQTVAKAAVLRPKLKPTSLQVASATLQKPIAATQAKLVLDDLEIAPKTTSANIASVAPTTNTIGCSKGVEIITGYGFSGVKPKSCSGSAYAFDATRANAAYIITLSAATGEITDVKKL